MSVTEFDVRNGPEKADLLRAVTNPSELRVFFDAPTDPIEARVDEMLEVGDGGSMFALRGAVTSGHLRGVPFSGTYDCSTRTGRIAVEQGP